MWSLVFNLAFGASDLGVAEAISYGTQFNMPLPAEVMALADRLQGSCNVIISSGNVQTINGASCPLADRSTFQDTGIENTDNYETTDSVKIVDPNLRAQLTIASASSSYRGVTTDTSTTVSFAGSGQDEIVTTTNHKIVLQYTQTYNETRSSGTNGDSKIQVQHVNDSDTLYFDGQKYTGTYNYDAVWNSGDPVCTIDGTQIGCQTYSYIFGYLEPG